MNYQLPAITADVIVLSPKNRSILLVKRSKSPFKEYWALPGGFFNAYDQGAIKADTSIEAAAWRELKEETGLDVDDTLVCQYKGFSQIRDALGRDPRGRTVAHVFWVSVSEHAAAEAGDDALDARWFSYDNLPMLAFDHNLVIDSFFKKP